MNGERDYQPIACALHDLLEIACLRGHWVSLELRNRPPLECRPVTTISGLRNAEWLRVEHRDGSQQEIRLDQIQALTPREGPDSGNRLTLVDG